MRVLVTWGSKRGGTEGIGQILAAELKARGHLVVAAPAADVQTLAGIDAAVIAGAIYANRWPAPLRRFVRRNTAALRRMPVWLCSSGPLDDSADRAPLPAPTSVAVLGEAIGAKDHVTFGGRLDPAATGFPAAAMAKSNAGDWRNSDRVRAWADAIAEALPSARPGAAVDHPARSLPLLAGLGIFAWAASAALTHWGAAFGGATVAAVAHAVAVPVIFAGLAWAYFGSRGAHEPLPTAAAWAALAVALDHAVLGRSGLGVWLPAAIAFLAGWGLGVVRSTMPWPRLPGPKPPPVAHDLRRGPA